MRKTLLCAFLILSFLTPALASDWQDILSRVYYGFNFEEDFKPTYYLETIAPLYQDADRNHTVFLEPRINYDSDARDFYNLGLGYRYYLSSRDVLLGTNVFGDFEREDRHGRVGFGLEVLGHHMDFRLNTYFAVSGARAEEEVGGIILYERALSGWDFELGTPVLLVPNTKIFVGGSSFDLKKADNTYSWKMRVEFKPTSYSVVNLSMNDANGSDPEWRIDTYFVFQFEPKPRPEKKDIRDRALHRVERQHRITKERFNSSGFSFSVAKA